MASTQQQYPARASWRTAVQTGISVLVTLGLVLPLVVQIISDEVGYLLPKAWLGWLVAIAGAVASVAAALARIMAIPAVDAALRRFGLSSTPDA